MIFARFQTEPEARPSAAGGISGHRGDSTIGYNTRTLSQVVAGELTVVEVGVETIGRQQTVVVPRFNNVPMIHDHNVFCVLNRGQPVCHHEAGPARQ